VGSVLQFAHSRWTKEVVAAFENFEFFLIKLSNANSRRKRRKEKYE